MLQAAAREKNGLKILADALAACRNDAGCAKQRLDASVYHGVSGELRFDAYGDVILPIVLKTVRQGRFAAIK